MTTQSAVTMSERVRGADRACAGAGGVIARAGYECGRRPFEPDAGGARMARRFDRVSHAQARLDCGQPRQRSAVQHRELRPGDDARGDRASRGHPAHARRDRARDEARRGRDRHDAESPERELADTLPAERLLQGTTRAAGVQISRRGRAQLARDGPQRPALDCVGRRTADGRARAQPAQDEIANPRADTVAVHRGLLVDALWRASKIRSSAKSIASCSAS